MKRVTSIALLAFCLCLNQFVHCEPSYAESNSNSGSSGSNAPDHRANTLLSELENEARNSAMDGNSGIDKRVERYAFGLGRRAYTYTNGNGVKRLPVYNFGLGKRARPYSFGLGKRSDYVDDMDDEQQLHNYDAELERFLDEKRSRPYSFGLGKREPMEDVERRGYMNRYGFGLGRR